MGVRTTEDLISGIAAGNSDAMALLYRTYAPGIYAFALSILKNTHDAQDVLQDTFVAVHSAAGSYVPQGKPMAWLVTIARNLCYRRLNAASREISLEPWICPGGTDAAQLAEDKLLVEQCLRLLSDEEREILLLHAVMGLRHRQIAEVTGLKLGTVLSKYSRAKQKLRYAIGEE